MKKVKPIIFDFRYDDESGDEPYQLVVSRADKRTDNTSLFFQFYHLLETLLKPGHENIYHYDLTPALEYHYWKFSPRFSFVNELADQYELAEKAGQLTTPGINTYLKYWLEQKGTNSAIYEGLIRLSALVDEDMALCQDIPVGTPYTYIPEPSSDLEAFQHLKFLMGPQVCEYNIREFEQKYKEPTPEIYASELAPINDFINDINYTEVKSAFERRDNDYAREYLRITHGYYDTHRCEQAMGNTASIVYGKYILYKKWLEDRLRESFSNKRARGLPQLIPNKVSSDFILGQDLFNVLYQRGLLSDFFQVPAPPVKGRFWYDISDAETDDPAKVVRVSPVTIRQKRRAKTDDFPIVLNQVNILQNKETKAYQHFLDDLVVCVQQMVELHRNLHKPEERDEQHYLLIELAEQFIEWLKSDNKNVAVAAPNAAVAHTQYVVSNRDIQTLDDLKQRTEDLPDILHLRAAAAGYQMTDEDKALLLDTYSKLDDILKELAAFINIRFPGCERHVKAWYGIDFDTKIGDIKIITTDREHTRREWRKGMFDLKSLIKILRNETVLLIDGDNNQTVANQLDEISSNHGLDHFTDKEVIPNQKLVNEIIDFFENGHGKDIFTPLEILNLLDKQKNFVLANYDNSELVIQTLKDLPLNDRAKHSLFGFLLKWFGGYPVNNMNEELNETLKLIQAAFLSFRDDTPEKQYCEVDQTMRNKFEKYGIAFTTAINHGIDVGELLAAMEDEEPEQSLYHSFPDLYAAAAKKGLIENINDRKNFLIAQSACNYQFNVWLQQRKIWEYRNEEQYEKLLTLDIFREFLTDKTSTDAKRTINDALIEVTAVQREEEKSLTMKQIALICHYTDCQVTRTTANGIVEKYGHTSGDKLFNAYSHYRSKANRVGSEATQKKNDNKLQLFESVQVYLKDNKTASAKIGTDLASLREAIEKS